MTLYPSQLARTDDGIRIEWSDGAARGYTAAELRSACPCATCREKRSEPPPMLPVLRPEEAQPPAIAAMRPVGHYAYNIAFTDGHDTGIFTFDLLRELGREA